MPPLSPSTTYVGTITVDMGQAIASSPLTDDDITSIANWVRNDMVANRAPTMPPLAPPEMGDTTSFAERVQAWYEAWRTDTIARADEQSERPTPTTEVEKRVNDVIDDIAAKRIAPHGPDATRIRGALDKAEAPLTGRDGADVGLGNAIGRAGRYPFVFNW